MKDVSCNESIALVAGPLSMVFEPAHAMLRYVRLRNIELVRGIFAAVRDQDWNTIPFSVHEVQLDQSPDQFSLSFLVKCAGRHPIRLAG